MQINEKQRLKLEKIVKRVKTFLSRFDIHVPFYIAGGCVFSILNKTNYPDIDVFFYNEQDVKKLDILNTKDFYITDNAITYPVIIYSEVDIYPEVELDKFQFIKIRYGEPLINYDTFDLNCCMCGITSDNEIILSDDFSNNIEINWKCFNKDTLNRYLKYVEYKGAIDNDKKQLELIFDYIINNFDSVYKAYYGEDFEITLHHILQRYCNYANNENKILLFKVIESKSPEQRLEIYEKLNFFFKYEEVKNPSNEYYLFAILNNYKYFKSMNEKKEIKNKVQEQYPEYFL